MSARFSRGSSVLAALILAAFVGGVILSIHQIAQNNQPSLAYSAASNVAGTTVYDTSSPPAQNNQQKSSVQADCTAAKNAAAANKSQTATESTSDTASNIKDSCVAAVPDSAKASLPPNNPDKYKCVGKTAVVSVQSNVTIKSSPNSNIPAGECSTIACQPAGDGEQQCVRASLIGLDGDKLSTYLSGSQPDVQPFTLKTSSLTGLYDENGLPLNPSETSVIDSALREQQDTTQAQIDQNTQSINDLQSYLDTCVQYSSGIGCSDYQQKQDQLDALQQQNKDLQNQMDGLKTAQKQDITPSTQQDTTQPTQTNNPGTDGFPDTVCTGSNQDPRCGSPDTFKPQSPCQNGGNPANNCQLPNGGPSGGPGGGGLPGGGGGQGGGGFGSGLSSALSSFMKGLMPGLMNALFPPQVPQQVCTSDPNAYNQALQQYQQQMQQYNQQLQQYNYQSQIAQYQGYPPPPQPQAPSQPCYTAPSGGGGHGASGTPTAQISCSPQTADVGMSIAISFSCGNSDSSAGSGFDTGGKTFGSASTTISNPPAGATAVTYSLQCRNRGSVAQSQCSVQITRPSIILVANPKIVAANASSTIGWVTTGMQSCVISSPDSQQFTAQNATDNSVNGVATTPPLASTASFVLNCTTTGGQLKAATTTVQVGSPSGGGQGAVTVTSSADGGSIARGGTVSVNWSAGSPPSGSHIELWLFDTGLQAETALIQSDLSASGTYSWVTPAATSSCASVYACGSDLVPGRSYAIEANLYTGASTSPAFIDYGFTPQNFSVSQ